MTPKFEVIDNFLDPAEFSAIKDLFYPSRVMDRIPWMFSEKVNFEVKDGEEDEHLQYYFEHLAYSHTALSPYMDKLSPLLSKFDIRALIRVKMNCYPSTQTIVKHKDHKDYPFSHQGAVFSINNCDGYTWFKDGPIIESVANRIVFFDGSILHGSTNCTNSQARFNINVNYL